MRTSGIIVIIILALLAVLGITVGTGMVGDNNNHQNISDMLPDNLESNNIVKMNDNGTYSVIDNNTHKVIDTATENKTIVTPENNSKDDAIELQLWEYVSVDPSDNTAPNIKKIGSNDAPDNLLSPAEIIKQNDLSTDEIVTAYVYVGTIWDGNVSQPNPILYEMNSPFYRLTFDAITGECVRIHTIEDIMYEFSGDLDNEFNKFIKSKTDMYEVRSIYSDLEYKAHEKLMEDNNISWEMIDIYSIDITNKGNGSTYTFISNVGNVTLDSDKNILNITAGGNDIRSDNFISQEEAINSVIEEVKEWPYVSGITFNATGPQQFAESDTTGYVVDAFTDGDFYMRTWVDARTGKIVNPVGSISKEEAINIVKPGVIKDVKEYLGQDFVSRVTFSASGPLQFRGEAVYVVDTFIDGNFFMETDVDARTGKIVESVGIGDASSGIREDGTWGPLTEEEYNKKFNITVNDTGSFKEDESIENGT